MYLSVSSVQSDESLVFINTGQELVVNNPKSETRKLKNNINISVTFQSLWLLTLIGFPSVKNNMGGT